MDYRPEQHKINTINVECQERKELSIVNSPDEGGVRKYLPFLPLNHYFPRYHIFSRIDPDKIDPG